VINPLRSEEEAFRFTLIVAVLLAPVALAALIFGSGVGLGVAGGLALGLVFMSVMRKRDEPPEKVALRRRPEEDDDSYRILVVANETLSGDALRREIAHRARGYETRLRVVTPALNTKLRHWTSDEDDARAAASRRLEAILAALRREGFDAEGNIGEGDPVRAT
jgi:hypothetical protein